jgi:multidrug efflux pump subunit AcrA (membrane-fusion protein)
MLENKEIELRSEEIQEIFSKIPHWVFRWGAVVILFIFISVILVSCLVKYPDVIRSEIIITTNIPPEKVVTKISGRIEAILVEDRGNVVQNTPLAIIESSANYQDVFLLKSIADTINIFKQKFPFDKLKLAQLGEVENAFAVFRKENVAENLNAKLRPYLVEGSAQSYEAIQLKDRLTILESQKSISQNEISLQKNDLDRYEILHRKGIISDQDIDKQVLVFLQVKKSYATLLGSISQLKSSLNELNLRSKTTRINENIENVNLEGNLIQSFYMLKKAIKDWELNYVLRSSINGKVAFLQVWNENQSVNVGDNVFSVIPFNEHGYVGKVTAAVQNSGKIKVGQVVTIRLANYPDREFGTLKGIVDAISLTPDKNGSLLINVSLPKGLQTSYKRQITFQQEMHGNADIIIEDLRLIDRILYQFRDLFRR